jgi:hypothetical protein
MAVLKKHLTPFSKGGSIKVHRGKGASEQTLPSRSALNTLTQGDPAQRSQQQYAKATPMANPLAGMDNED